MTLEIHVGVCPGVLSFGGMMQASDRDNHMIDHDWRRRDMMVKQGERLVAFQEIRAYLGCDEKISDWQKASGCKD